MNVPNKLSLFRILVVPVILVFLLPARSFSFIPESWNIFVEANGRVIAGILFVIASLTDLADGEIARKYNLVTNLGKFLDALADKMLVISVMIALVDLGRISSVFVIIIVLREFMVTGIRLVASEKGVVIAAKILGKIKTATQMTALIFLLFEPLIVLLLSFLVKGADGAVYLTGDILFLLCVIMTILSGLDYLLKNLHYFREK